MATFSIDYANFTRMFISGANALEANKAWINDLNVFPVPDGDTGTNMSMTLAGAVKEVSQPAVTDLSSAVKAISFGSLRGARGNSGVILSQLLRGFCKVLQGAEALDAFVISEACGKAIETAYKAVMKPKEGTILTVARGMAEKWAELCAADNNLESLMENVLAYGDEVLAHTPDMLPVLKEAGVVDSGGQGLMVFLKGNFACLMGQEVVAVKSAGTASEETRSSAVSSGSPAEEIRFGYCTEFLINLDKPLTDEEEASFKAYLESLGDSIVMVADEGICKVHVHTNDPGLAIQRALTYGGLTNMKIDNMRYEHEEKLIRDASRIAAQQARDTAEKEVPESEWKEVGFISTSVGEGLSEIFLSLGVDAIVEGGQTMNPSTEDMLEAIGRVPARNIFVLPNNKNIILAAEQAATLTKDKKVVVIPTTNIPAGITALTSFLPEATVEENTAAMQEAISLVKSGEVTYSVRSTSIGGKEIHEGDYMGLGGPDGLYAVGTDRDEVTLRMIADMVDGDSGLITLYYGEGVSASESEAMRERLTKEYPDCDIEVLSGGQPVYRYIVSVE